MAIYELTAKAIESLSDARFADLGLKERDDLQRIPRDRVNVVAPGAVVLAEEFGDLDELMKPTQPPAVGCPLLL